MHFHTLQKIINAEKVIYALSDHRPATTSNNITVYHTLRKNPLKLEDLQGFIACYIPPIVLKERKKTFETCFEGRWRKFRDLKNTGVKDKLCMYYFTNFI